jgi:hypothetical protein
MIVRDNKVKKRWIESLSDVTTVPIDDNEINETHLYFWTAVAINLKQTNKPIVLLSQWANEVVIVIAIGGTFNSNINDPFTTVTNSKHSSTKCYKEKNW